MFYENKDGCFLLRGHSQPFSSILTCAPGSFVHKRNSRVCILQKKGIAHARRTRSIQWVLFSTMFTLLLRMKNKNGVCVK